MLKTSATSFSSEEASYTPNEIICTICGACHTLWQPPQGQPFSQALERAYMSACHYCFRCRRPACPQCWDAVNGACGVCVEEAHLPFRAEIAPLAGLTFPPLRRPEPQDAAHRPPPIVCTHPGRFQAELEQLGFISTESASTMMAEPETTKPGVVAVKQPRERTRKRKKSPKIPVRPKQDVEDETRETPPRRISATIERVLTLLLVLILLTVAGSIIAAELSPAANGLLVQLLHIDIRYEIAYLLTLIHQLVH